MPAGTITLTNNSAVVKGAGTAFNTELKSGDMIVSIVGGVTYTLPVKAIDSATQVTLIKAYDGPTQAGAAWSAVPRETLNAITAQLASETAKALRGLNYDKENWQQVFSGTGNITVKLPDGSTFTGPAWNSFTTALNLKADKTDLDKKVDKTSLGNSATRDVGTGTGNVAAGNDSRFNSIDGNNGGELSRGSGISLAINGSNNTGGYNTTPRFETIIRGRGATSDPRGAKFSLIAQEFIGTTAAGILEFDGFGKNYTWRFNLEGNGTAPGSWIGNSDRRIKTNLETIDNALSKVKKLTGYTGLKDGHPFTGLIAQDVQDVLPQAVSVTGDLKLQNGDMVENVLGVSYGELAGLLVEAIKELSLKVSLQDEEIIKLKESKNP
jgi:hypothetical protein